MPRLVVVAVGVRRLIGVPSGPGDRILVVLAVENRKRAVLGVGDRIRVVAVEVDNCIQRVLGRIPMVVLEVHSHILAVAEMEEEHILMMPGGDARRTPIAFEVDNSPPIPRENSPRIPRKPDPAAPSHHHHPALPSSASQSAPRLPEDPNRPS